MTINNSMNLKQRDNNKEMEKVCLKSYMVNYRVKERTRERRSGNLLKWKREFSFTIYSVIICKLLVLLIIKKTMN